jgi:hypothetical protein
MNRRTGNRLTGSRRPAKQRLNPKRLVPARRTPLYRAPISRSPNAREERRCQPRQRPMAPCPAGAFRRNALPTIDLPTARSLSAVTPSPQRFPEENKLDQTAQRHCPADSLDANPAQPYPPVSRGRPRNPREGTQIKLSRGESRHRLSLIAGNLHFPPWPFVFNC